MLVNDIVASNRPRVDCAFPSESLAVLIRLLLTGLALLCGVQAVPAQTEISEPLSERARAVFDRSRDKVLQIRILHRDTQAQTVIGSGWVATSNGLAITNYHVVSEYVAEPDRYQVEYVRSDGMRGDLQVLAVDIIHDLALVSLKGTALPAFTISERALKKGDRGFSMGNPHDLGLTIVEGTFNGKVEFTLNDQFHFTGAINAGMSGGPAVTADGRVFGVNVAALRDGQLVSFLVPAKYVVELLNRAPKSAPDPAKLKDEVENQLLTRQDSVFAALLTQPLNTSTFGRYTVPDTFGVYMRCWGGSEIDRSKPYEIAYKNCDAQSDVFVSEELDTGGLNFRHELIVGKRLDTLRFSSLYRNNFAKSFPEGPATKQDVTKFRCQEDFVTSQSGMLRAVLCLRAHRRFKGLFDMRLKFASLDRNTEGLQSWLSVDGISYANGMSLSKRFLEAIRWTP